jgi:putative ABC transport system permease protein
MAGTPLHYHVRSLFVRKTTTLLTVLVVAAVVGTFAWLLGFAAAIRGALAVASDPHKLIVMQRGSLSETNSSIAPDEFNRLHQLSNVARDADGTPLISPEMYWQTQLPRIADQGTTRANVALRGVTDLAFQVHRNVHRLGATFSTGSPEVIVGRAAAWQFAGLNIGDTVRLGFGDNRDYRVVGHFSAGGGPMESEIWAYLPSLQSAYGRTAYSSASVRLRPEADARSVIEQIEGPAIQLGAQTEAQYWKAQSANIELYKAVCYVLIAMMAVAAVVSIANTMFATVAGRTREVAMLRTIGFSGAQVMAGFLIEALVLALLGGVLGCLGCLAWLGLAGRTKDMFGANTFTTMAFEIRLTPATIVLVLATVTVVGTTGALFPAMRAARTRPVVALREA